jgi:hypothetical protein
MQVCGVVSLHIRLCAVAAASRPPPVRVMADRSTAGAGWSRRFEARELEVAGASGASPGRQPVVRGWRLRVEPCALHSKVRWPDCDPLPDRPRHRVRQAHRLPRPRPPRQRPQPTRAGAAGWRTLSHGSRWPGATAAPAGGRRLRRPGMSPRPTRSHWPCRRRLSRWSYNHIPHIWRSRQQYAGNA